MDDDINARDEVGATRLFEAVSNDHLAEVRRLLALDAIIHLMRGKPKTVNVSSDTLPPTRKQAAAMLNVSKWAR